MDTDVASHALKGILGVKIARDIFKSLLVQFHKLIS